jgi:type IV secretion system protein VirB8
MSALEKISAEDEQRSYRAGLSWEVCLEILRQRSERRAWLVAGAACVIAACAVTGIATLAPLRRVVPYLYMVDKATGNVEFVGAINDLVIKGYQELLDKHWAQVYIKARESYFYKLLQSDYDTVMALSDNDIGKEYTKLYEGSNARDSKYGDKTQISTSIISLRLDPSSKGDQIIVRFSKTTCRVGTVCNELPEYFVASIRYQYLPSMLDTEKQLLLNPLGYKVVGYRVDAELVPVEAPAKPAQSGRQP